MPDVSASAPELRKIRSAGDLPIASSSRAVVDSSRPTRLHTVSKSIGGISDGQPAPIPEVLSDDATATQAMISASESQSQTPARTQRPPPVIVVDRHINEPPESGPSSPSSLNVHPPSPPPRQHNRSNFSQIMAYFGYGRTASRARRMLVSLLWNIGWGFVQIVVIITLSALAAHTTSKTDPDITEWTACDRPLGLWACLWIVRVVLSCILSYWGYVKDRKDQASRSDTENGTASLGRSGGASANNSGAPGTRRARPSPQRNNDRRPNGANGLPSTASQTDMGRSFRRLSLFSSLYSLSWFLTAHILVYTSVNTCRHSSPHVWWLVFGILCITYILVLEVIILGFVIFIITPILFLIWNIFLMCIGRHPVQNPHMIRPDIGKLPKAVVEKIPLVMYIPPPPDAAPTDGPIKVPETVHTYPPKSPQAEKPKRRQRFKFWPSKKTMSSKDVTSEKAQMKLKDLDKPGTWEENWKTEGYPFVILEGHRASCAICLMDFEEPERLGDASPETLAPPKTEVATPTSSDKIADEQRTESQQQLRLADSGEGAQPLRLLKCGHVFHKTCIDPWLTDVSGRCPVCQRPVEIPEEDKKKKHRRQSRAPQ